MNQKQQVVIIRAENQLLTHDLFSRLCDVLSEHRWWCSDYRSFSDFNPAIQHMFWESYSYFPSDQMVIDACLDSVQQTTAEWLQKHTLPADAVTVFTVNREI